MLFAPGCKPDVDFDMPNLKKQLVIDGWIEKGQYARVLLTYNSPYFSNLDSASLRDLLATRATVILTDGIETEKLILSKDTNYFPSYLYLGNSIIGKEGSIYSLIVIDEVDSAFATTSIAPSPSIDTAWFELKPNNDSLGVIKCKIKDNILIKEYYRTFTMVKGKNHVFIASLYPCIDDQYFNGKEYTFTLQKGSDSYLKPFSDIYFKKGDTVVVKISTVDSRSYRFWNAYQEEVFNSASPFSANHNSIESNIENGLGIWCGYNSDYYSFVAK